MHGPDGARTLVVDDGTRLSVSVRGRGPALLLAHGFGGAKEDFGDHVEALARTHTVVSFDHRGHGASDGPDDPDLYTFARAEADVLAVADDLGLATFRLLGHSFGGMVARRVALDRPDRVEALVLMDTSGGPVPGLDPEVLELAADLARREGKDALKAVLDAVTAAAAEESAPGVDDRPEHRAFVERKWAALSEHMWAGLARAIARQPDDHARLGAIACPTLVLVGERDRPFRRASRDLVAAMPRSRLVVVPGAGHEPQIEAPRVWRAAVEGFLASLPGAAATGARAS